MAEHEQDWYFTFGYSDKGPGIGHYAKFFGTYGSAREQMFNKWGKNWCFQYPSAEKAGIQKFNLKEV